METITFNPSYEPTVTGIGCQMDININPKQQRSNDQLMIHKTTMSNSGALYSTEAQKQNNNNNNNNNTGKPSCQLFSSKEGFIQKSLSHYSTQVETLLSDPSIQSLQLTQSSQYPSFETSFWKEQNTLCYYVDANGICVARRQDNNMINGTKLLNVTGMSRGKRDGILKNEKSRVVVKVGPMHLKGVWITFNRAKELSEEFMITESLYPLFLDDPVIYFQNMQIQNFSIHSVSSNHTEQTKTHSNKFQQYNFTPFQNDTCNQLNPKSFNLSIMNEACDIQTQKKHNIPSNTFNTPISSNAASHYFPVNDTASNSNIPGPVNNHPIYPSPTNNDHCVSGHSYDLHQNMYILDSHYDLTDFTSSTMSTPMTPVSPSIAAPLCESETHNSDQTHILTENMAFTSNIYLQQIQPYTYDSIYPPTTTYLYTSAIPTSNFVSSAPPETNKMIFQFDNSNLLISNNMLF